MVVQHETKEDGETALQDGGGRRGGQLLDLGPPRWGEDGKSRWSVRSIWD